MWLYWYVSALSKKENKIVKYRKMGFASTHLFLGWKKKFFLLLLPRLIGILHLAINILLSIEDLMILVIFAFVISIYKVSSKVSPHFFFYEISFHLNGCHEWWWSHHISGFPSCYSIVKVLWCKIAIYVIEKGIIKLLITLRIFYAFFFVVIFRSFSNLYFNSFLLPKLF